jgi:sec-independent protein translocase protein TatA
MFGLTFQEMLVVGIIAIVLFGSKLPEVAKMLGQHYARFRKSLADLQAQVNLHEIYDPRPSSSSYSSKPSASYSSFDDHDEATAPRFEPPPSEPQPGSADKSADAV